MKIKATVNLIVLGKEARLSESTKKESYQLAVMQGSEAGNISCVEDVYKNVKPFHGYSVNVVYDDKYQYMRVVGVDLKSEKMAVS